MTKDLDIVPSPDQNNLEKLAEMLRDLDARILDAGDFTAAEMSADPTRTADLEVGGNFCLLTDLGRLDVIQWLSGIEADDPYGEFAPDAVEGRVDDIPVRVCSVEHLRTMKQAAGRPQDLDDDGLVWGDTFARITYSHSGAGHRTSRLCDPGLRLITEYC